MRNQMIVPSEKSFCQFRRNERCFRRALELESIRMEYRSRYKYYQENPIYGGNMSENLVYFVLISIKNIVDHADIIGEKIKH